MRLLGLACVLGLAAAGCSQPVKRVDPTTDDEIGGTGLDSADVTTMTDDMARSLLSAQEIFQDGTPRVYVRDITNNTRFFVDRSLLVDELRTNLIRSSDGKIRFLAREFIDAVLDEREAKREGAVGVTTDREGAPKLGEISGADYILTGKLQGISKTTGGDASDYLRASFTLVDAETAEIVWEDDYRVKKVGEEGVVYR